MIAGIMSSSDDELPHTRILDSNQLQNGSDSLSNTREDQIKRKGLLLKPENTGYNPSPEYLAQLLSDKKKLQTFPGLFVHLEKLLVEEIGKVRRNLFHLIPSTLSKCLPQPEGPTVILSEKLSVPVNEYPDYNFVGRILGPRGRTAKQLEQDMDCKIMIRGKGSTRNACKVDATKPSNEHQNEDLHILITVEDSENRAKMKLQLAVEQVKKLLIPAPEGEDSLKKKQLMELAIINGTYRETRPSSSSSSSSPSSMPKIINSSQMMGRSPVTIHNSSMGLIASTPSNGTPIILTQARLPFQISPNTSGGLLNGCLQRAPVNGQSLIGSGFLNGLESHGGILVQFDPNIVQPTYFDLAYPLDSSQTGPLRRGKLNIREQPYLR